MMAETFFPRDYVCAEWTYSELQSPTQGDRYRHLISSEILLKSRNGLPFDQLEINERAQLASAWNKVRGLEIFGQALNGFTNFRLTEWTRDELARSYVIPMFAGEVGNSLAPFTFRHWIETDSLVDLHTHHARDANAAQYRPDHEPALAALVAISTMLGVSGVAYWMKAFMLLDGYHRAVSLWRRNDPSDRLRIYVPV
jgi:hypothetical protein